MITYKPVIVKDPTKLMSIEIAANEYYSNFKVELEKLKKKKKVTDQEYDSIKGMLDSELRSDRYMARQIINSKKKKRRWFGKK